MCWDTAGGATRCCRPMANFTPLRATNRAAAVVVVDGRITFVGKSPDALRRAPIGEQPGSRLFAPGGQHPGALFPLLNRGFVVGSSSRNTFER
jgi:hypothetical protein